MAGGNTWKKCPLETSSLYISIFVSKCYIFHKSNTNIWHVNYAITNTLQFQSNQLDVQTFIAKKFSTLNQPEGKIWQRMVTSSIDA